MINLTNELNVLIVDNNAFSRKEIKFSLQENGVRNIFEVEDGTQAMDALNAKEQDFFDLIICEIEITPKSGLDLLIKVKANPKFVKIPFAIIAGNKDRDKILQAQALKADDYIVKPIMVDHFKTRIRNIIARKIEEFIKELKEYSEGAAIASSGSDYATFSQEERVKKALNFFELRMNSLNKMAGKMKLAHIVKLSGLAEDLAYKAQFSEKRKVSKVFAALWDAASTIQVLFNSLDAYPDLVEMASNRLLKVARQLQVAGKNGETGDSVATLKKEENSIFARLLQSLVK